MNYQLVVINNMFELSEEKEVGKYFGDVLMLKKLGYGSKHEAPYLPVASDDFVGIHALVYDADSMTPVLCFKTTPFEVCEHYSIGFPLSQYINSVCNTEEIEKISEYLNVRKKEGLTYSGGWTVNPAYKGRNLSSELKNVYTGIHYLLHTSYGLNSFAAIGVSNFKTDEFFRDSWGVEFLVSRELHFTSCPHLRCNVIAMDFKNAIEDKKLQAQKYKEIWENRLELSAKVSVKQAA